MTIHKVIIPLNSIQFVEIHKPRKLYCCEKVGKNKATWFQKFYYPALHPKRFDHPEGYIHNDGLNSFFMTEEEVNNSKDYMIIDGEVYKKPYINIGYTGGNFKMVFNTLEELTEYTDKIEKSIHCITGSKQ